jgi:hypothetical protein
MVCEDITVDEPPTPLRFSLEKKEMFQHLTHQCDAFLWVRLQEALQQITSRAVVKNMLQCLPHAAIVPHSNLAHFG